MERFHVCLFKCFSVSKKYKMMYFFPYYNYSLIKNMKHEGILHPVSEIDIFALHFVFLTLMQSDFDFYKNSWNCHRMKTCGHKSPSGINNLREETHQTGKVFTELIQVCCFLVKTNVNQRLIMKCLYVYSQTTATRNS